MKESIELVRIGETLGFDSNKPLGNSWSLLLVYWRKTGLVTARRPIYPSQNFWTARSYATVAGGETVDFAIKAAEETIQQIEKLASNPAQDDRHDKSELDKLQIKALGKFSLHCRNQ